MGKRLGLKVSGRYREVAALRVSTVLYYIIYWDILVKSFMLGFYWDTFIRTTKKIRLSNLSCVIIASLLYISLYFLLFIRCNVFIYLFGELHLHYWED